MAKKLEKKLEKKAAPVSTPPKPPKPPVVRGPVPGVGGDDRDDNVLPRPAVDVEALKRRLAARRDAKEKAIADEPLPPPSVSAGPVGALTEVMVNPAADKILEFTDLDRNQVSLIPQLLLISEVWEQCIEIAAYRSDTVLYLKKFKRERPVWPDLMNKYVFRIAQCRRSLGGKTLKALEDLTLAEIDRRDDSQVGGGGGFDD